MADNVTLPGSGVVIRSVDLGGGIEAQVILVADSAGNLVPTTLLTNGRGLNVVTMNDQPVKGMANVGDLATGLLPVFLGGAVGAGIAQRTLIGDSHVVQMSFTGDGRLLVLDCGPPEDQGLTNPVALAADSASHTMIGAQAAGIKIALWGFALFNPSATATSIKIIDQTGTPTTLGEFPVPPLPGVQAARWPYPLRGTAATPMNYQLTASLGGGSVTPFWYITKE